MDQLNQNIDYIQISCGWEWWNIKQFLIIRPLGKPFVWLIFIHIINVVGENIFVRKIAFKTLSLRN
ncbi:hypothetical protein [Chryseobacterium sp. HSC-36S06]|uniref:hypothetical protein n=1 Tax=Chryseobacterium sp. HSC-36S06 TaxID=2910970 RepID=UPI00209F9AB8|nr:hypothetical protein [Chryseobacterium sp. HSC-36S06]MCP2038822.1 hypothetical protein [Chryseobacterium sp. HSC-36S06]